MVGPINLTDQNPFYTISAPHLKYSTVESASVWMIQFHFLLTFRMQQYL